MRRLVFVLLCFLSGPLSAADISFKPKGSFSLQQLKDQVPAQTVEVREPHENVPIRFEAIPLKDILDKIYGPAWRKEEELLITCQDGYQPSLPVQKILAHSPYLAFAAKDRAFSIVNKLQANEKVDLGPYYLVWENQKDELIQLEGASLWPYQVVALEFVRFEAKFGALAPPPSASAKAKAGFLAYRVYCQSCHRINGQGGDKSLELNFPMSVTEYYKGDVLRKWILDPQSVRWGSLMPPLNPALKNRESTVDDIIAYLEAMQRKKLQPK